MTTRTAMPPQDAEVELVKLHSTSSRLTEAIQATLDRARVAEARVAELETAAARAADARELASRPGVTSQRPEPTMQADAPLKRAKREARRYKRRLGEAVEERFQLAWERRILLDALRESGTGHRRMFVLLHLLHQYERGFTAAQLAECANEMRRPRLVAALFACGADPHCPQSIGQVLGRYAGIPTGGLVLRHDGGGSRHKGTRVWRIERAT